MQYLYVHDILTTTVANKTLFQYCSKNKIDFNDIATHVRLHITQKPNDSTEVAILQCYECDALGTVNQQTKQLVTVIGEQYTHYVLDPDGAEVKFLAKADEFDICSNRYTERRFNKESFFTEKDSNMRVVELIEQKQKVYGNSHKFINEFCYNLYEEYLDVTEFKGRLIEKPSGFEYPFLMNASMIGKEIVVFGTAKSIHVVNDSDIKHYSYEHKTLTFDIETIMVDSNGNKMDCEIIQLSATYQEGKHLRRVIGITVGEAISDTGFYGFDHLAQYFETTPDVEIISVQNEKQLLEAFIDICTDVKPDYLAGYNVLGFDFQILLTSAERYKIHVPLYDRMVYMSGFYKPISFKKTDRTDIQQFDLNYNTFPGILINDLYRCHKGEKLDELSKQSFGVGKEDVSYTDIPRLFYSSNVVDRSKLLKYNIVDSLLCAALINTTDNFASYTFFVVSSDTAKVPHSQFYNLQKTTLIMPMMYYRYKKKHMLQDVKIKPASENNRVVLKEILKYFLYNENDVCITGANEIIDQFKSGEIKTKTIRKHFDFDIHYGSVSQVDFHMALQILDEQIQAAKKKNTKHGPYYYTLTHLLLYVRFLTEPTTKRFDMKRLCNDYFKYDQVGRYSVNLKKRKSIELLVEEENDMCAEFTRFVEYLASITLYKTHTLKNILSNYIENEMSNTKYKKQLENFAYYLNNDRDGYLDNGLIVIVNAYKEACAGQRFNDEYTSDTFAEEVYWRIGKNLLMKFDLPYTYDGAYVYLPNKGVEFENPICCLDFSSMYPSIALSLNMGPETVVSMNTIDKHNLIPGEDFTPVNIYSRDDHRNINLNALTKAEAHKCYVFFLTQKRVRSITCEVWGDLLNDRLKYKRLIGTYQDVKDNVLVEEKSNTLKIVANSVYGILPLIGLWKISACVTSMGRQHIQKVGWYIQETRQGTIVYGDTDSVMFHFGLTTQELCNSLDAFVSKGWLHDCDKNAVQKYNDDCYKKACFISASLSKRLAQELNEMHLKQREKAIFTPPSKLEHEKVMLPFVIFGRKHYFAKVVDTDKNDSYIIRGLEIRRRNRLKATEIVETAMFKDLLQRNPNTFETFSVANSIVSALLDGTIDLNLISSRKKISVAQNRMNFRDAGVELFNRMKDRGEVVETGGLDKLSIDVIKVQNTTTGVKYDSLTNLKSLQLNSQKLDLDNRAVVKQILNEVTKIMSVVHPPETYLYYGNLLKLRTEPNPDRQRFEEFRRPDHAKKTIYKDTPATSTNNTLHNYFQISLCGDKRKRISEHIVPQKRFKQTTLSF
jgi:DNA polymerase elongation subunit (family B)